MSEQEMTIGFIGNPNCGKTTMFNDLTGANQYVGNWPGVTVEKKEVSTPRTKRSLSPTFRASIRSRLIRPKKSLRAITCLMAAPMLLSIWLTRPTLSATCTSRVRF